MNFNTLLLQCREFTAVEAQRLGSLHYELEKSKQVHVSNAKQFINTIEKNIDFLQQNSAEIENEQSVPENLASTVSFIVNIEEIQQILPLAQALQEKFKSFVPSPIDDNEKELLASYIASLKYNVVQAKSGQITKREDHSIFANILESTRLPFTYLHDALRTSVNFVQSRIQPRYNQRQFERLLEQQQIPLSAPLSAYPKYMFLGKIFTPKYGYYVDCVESSEKLELVDRKQEGSKQEQETDIFVVLGKLFIQQTQELTDNINAGLKAARVAAAVNSNGELSIPILVTRGDAQSALNAYLELFRTVVRQERSKNAQMAHESQIQGVQDAFKAISEHSALQENFQLLELLNEALSKENSYFQALKRFRQSRNYLFQLIEQNQATNYGIVLTCTEVNEDDSARERQQCEQLCANLSLLNIMCKYIQYTEILAVEQQKINWMEENQKFVQNELDLKKTLLSQLLCDSALPVEFEAKTIDENLGGRTRSLQAKVALISNNQTAQTEIQFTKLVSADISPLVSRLGTDISVSEKPVYLHLKHNFAEPLKLKVRLELGAVSEEINLPIEEGETRSAVDFASEKLSFCCGFYMRVGRMEEARKQLNFAMQEYDPNLVIPIVEAVEEEQQKEEVEVKTTMTIETYKRALKKHFELEDVSPDNNLHPKNFVNLVEKCNGFELDKIVADARIAHSKTYLLDISAKTLFEDEYKGLLGETLFLYQYIRNLKHYYEELLAKNCSIEKLLVNFPDFTAIKNPLIIPPFIHKSRPLYPVRVLERERSRIKYLKFEQLNNQKSRDISQSEFISLYVKFNTVSLNFKPGACQFYVFTRVTGNLESDVQIGPIDALLNILEINQELTFNVPLPAIFTDTGEKVGFDESPDALAELPFSLNIKLFEFDSKYSGWALIGQISIPLRSLFLKESINSEIQQKMFSFSLIIAFRPAILLQNRPDLQFCNIDAADYAGALPGDFSSKIEQIMKINTRLSDISEEALEIERVQLQSFTPAQKERYYTKYATKLAYFERGITLFCETLEGRSEFLSQFMPTAVEADNLVQELALRSESDAIDFAVAVPFVPDAFVRSYVACNITIRQEETRMSTAETFSLCGGDYFEHACLLSSVLNSLEINSYVARVSTETLENEYFVLVIKQEENYFIDPVKAIKYPFLSPYIVKLSLLFNNQAIYINESANLRPDSVDLKNYIGFAVQASQSNQMLTDYIPKKEIGQDETLQNALIEAIRNDFTHRREPQNTMFDETVSEELQKGDLTCLENFEYQILTMKCAYEDAAILLERINESELYNTEQKVEFAISVVVHGFGNRFAALDIKLARLSHKDGGVEQNPIVIEGGKFGTQM